ncbi:hypothetical protein D3C87_1147490 [compost metagenome]
MIELSTVTRAIRRTLNQVARPALIRDQNVVATILIKVQLVIRLSLTDRGLVASPGLMRGHDLPNAILSEAGDVAIARLSNGRTLAAAELAAGLRAFPVAGVDLVVIAHRGSVEHVAVAVLVGEVHVAITHLIERQCRVDRFELVGVDRVAVADLGDGGGVVFAEALVDHGFVAVAVLVDGGLAGQLRVLPDFRAVEVAELVDGDVAAGAVALVAVGVVAFAGLVDADLAAVVQHLFGSAVVGGTVLGDH